MGRFVTIILYLQIDCLQSPIFLCMIIAIVIDHMLTSNGGHLGFIWQAQPGESTKSTKGVGVGWYDHRKIGECKHYIKIHGFNLAAFSC